MRSEKDAEEIRKEVLVTFDGATRVPLHTGDRSDHLQGKRHKNHEDSVKSVFWKYYGER